MEERSIRIAGVTSAREAHRVEQALNTVPNVTATVDPASGKALVCAEPQVPNDALREAVREVGCRVVEIK